MVTFYFSDTYNKSLEKIEDFIVESTENLEYVEDFLDEHDKILDFISENPDTPSFHPETGDQSWPFGDGKYRIFFRVIKDQDRINVFLIHIIDNRQANLEIYPNNSISVKSLIPLTFADSTVASSSSGLFPLSLVSSEYLSFNLCKSCP